jgi:hypothetical protein
MKYIVLSRLGKLLSTSLPKSKRLVSKSGYQPIAACDSKEDAEGIIMGLRINKIIETYTSVLPTDIKIAMKSELAQVATEMYNNIVTQ